MQDVFRKSSFSVVFTTVYYGVVLAILAGCTNSTPLVEMLENSGIASKALSLSAFSPAANPSNSLTDKSVQVSGSSAWTAAKTVIVAGVGSCAAADFSQATATTLPVTVRVPTPTEGTYKVCALGKKITGEWQDPSEAASSEVMTVDATAPMETAFFSNDPAYLNTNLTVQLSFTEPMQPLTANSLNISNGLLLSILPLSTSSYEITVSPLVDGTVSVALKPANILDLAGNPFGNGALVLSRIYDKTAPASPTIVIDGAAARTNNVSAALNLSASGSPTEMYITNQSGCASGGTWEPYTTSKGWTLTPNVVNNLYVKFRDAALNESSCAAAVIIHDNVPPVASFEAPATTYFKGQLIVGIVLTEELAGLSESGFQYSNVSGRGVLSGSGLNYQLSVTPVADGPVTITLPTTTIVDLAGNLAVSSATIVKTADNTAPVAGGGIALGPVPKNKTDSPTISISFSDTGSGVDHYEMKLRQGSSELISWTQKNSGDSFHGLSLLENSDYTVDVKAVDLVGNVSSVASATWRTYQRPYTLAPWTLTPNHDVYAIAQALGGGILVGGDFTGFTAAAGFTRFGTKVAADGQGVAAFATAPGFDNPVTASVTLGDGSVVVGGQFMQYRGVESNFIAHVNPDGSLDANFSAGGGFDMPVMAIVAVPGGFVVGGDFTTYRGTHVGHIAKIDLNGNLDFSFITGDGFDERVNVLAVDGDGSIFAGGNFATYNGASAPRLAKIVSTGARAAAANFNIGTGFTNGDVLALQILSDDSLIVGGSFLNFQGNDFAKILRLDATGAKVPAFAPISAPDNDVAAIAAVDDDHIFIGGSFNHYNSLPHQGLVMIDKTGAIDANFTNNPGVNGKVAALAVIPLAGGDVAIGGSFTKYDQTTGLTSLVRVNIAGTLVTPNFHVGPANATGTSVQTIAAFADESLFLGGAFESYGFTGPAHLAQVTNDTLLPVAGFASGIANFDGPVKSLAVQTSGAILASGPFTKYNGASAPGLARLLSNGNPDVSFNANVGTGAVGGEVKRVLPLKNGSILVAGSFSSFSGVSNTHVIALQDSGITDTSWKAQGANDAILDMAEQSTGKVVFVGTFGIFNSQFRYRIARTLAGAAEFGLADGNFAPSGFDGDARRVIVQNDDKIVVAGTFTQYAGAPGLAGFVRLDAEGALDTAFLSKIGAGPDGEILDMRWNGPTKTLLLVGKFEHFNGQPHHNIVRLFEDGSIDTSFSVDNGFDGAISTAKILASGDIAIGGIQYNYLGAATYNFSVLHPPAN